MQHISDHVAPTSSWAHPTTGTGCVKTSSAGTDNANIVPKEKDHNYAHMVNYRRYPLSSLFGVGYFYDNDFFVYRNFELI